MKVFLSSVITGYEAIRDAAAEALEGLDHKVLRAEDFAAKPTSAQIACLSGVRDADFVVLVLGERYGAIPPGSKISPTHEEFEEAKHTKPLFVFVQTGIKAETEQEHLIKAAQEWTGGAFTASFRTPAELRTAVSRAIHRWQLSEATAPTNPRELAKRAAEQIDPDDARSGAHQNKLYISLAGSPKQQILRPSEIDKEAFARDIKREASYGPAPIFDDRLGTTHVLENHHLEITQKDRRLRISQEGSILMELPFAKSESGFETIVEEDVRDLIERALRFALNLLQRIDHTERLSTIAIAADVGGSSYTSWMTRAEVAKSGGSRTISHFGRDGDSKPVMLQPAHLSRGGFRSRVEEIAEDLTALLRRKIR